VKLSLNRVTWIAPLVAVCFCNVQAWGQANNARPVGTSVAVIDLAEVFKGHKRLNAQLEEVKKDIQAYEAYINQERAKINGLAAELKTLDPTNPDYSVKEKALASMQADLQIKNRQKSREFLEREAKIRYNAYEEIRQHVAKFCQTYNIQLVIRFNNKPIDAANPQDVQIGLSRLVVYQNSLDITGYIIKSLDTAAPPTSVGSRGPIIPGRRQ